VANSASASRDPSIPTFQHPCFPAQLHWYPTCVCKCCEINLCRLQRWQKEMEIKMCNNGKNKQSLINVYTLSGWKFRLRWAGGGGGWLPHAQNVSMTQVEGGGVRWELLRVPLINVVLIMIMADVASCCTVERKGAAPKELMNSKRGALRPHRTQLPAYST